LIMDGSVTGFEPIRVLAAELRLSTQQYPTYESRLAFTQTVLEKVRALPGVRSAAIANNGLFRFGSWQTHLSIQETPATQTPPVGLSLVSADYLRTFGIPLRGGRDFTAEEIAVAAPAALINEETAKLWPAGRNPIGSRVRLDPPAPVGSSFLAVSGGAPEVLIVGIIASTKSSEELGVTAAPLVLLPYSRFAPLTRRIFVRTQGKPMLVWESVQQQVQAIDPDQPIFQPLAVEDSLNLETGKARLYMILFGFVGVLGLILAAAGIYGVLSYAVACRTREIAIRIALGATPSELLGMVLVDGAKLLAGGLAIGLAGSSVILGHANIPSVPKTDSLAILAVLTLLTAAALAASCQPARRAARLDPLVALRRE
jgi:putative ABC transport system permease protein